MCVLFKTGLYLHAQGTMTYKATYIRNAGTYLSVAANGAITQIKSLLDDAEHPTSYVVSSVRLYDT